MKELATLQLILKANPISNYTGNIEGNYESSIQPCVNKLIDYIKTKNDTVKDLSITVNEDGHIDGSVSLLASLLNESDSSELYKVFEKSPFVNFSITNEESLKSAISKTRAGLQSSFSNSSVNMSQLLNEFDNAIKDNKIDDLQQAMEQLNLFVNSVPGKSIKTAIQLAIKNSNILLKKASSSKK